MSVKIVEKTRHNGVVYEIGQVIHNITEEESQRLINIGSAVSDSTSISLPPIDDDDEYLKLLDESFNSDGLKDAAVKAGLTFPGNIGKKKLIDLIIEQEKEEDVLSFVKEEE